MFVNSGKRWMYTAMYAGIATLFLCASLFATVFMPISIVRAADISSQYTWKPLKIGAGGFVTGLVAHPSTQGLVYARTDVGGAYRWDEASHTWTQMIAAPGVPNPTPGDTNVESVAVSKNNNQVVYVAVGSDLNSASGRILKSTNRGQNWSDNGQRWTIAGNAEYRTGAERLAVDPANGGVVYFGSRKEGLWVTTNGGGNWSQVSTSQIPVGTNSGNPAGVKFVVFDPQSGTIGGKTKRIYAGVAGQGVYVSNDAGASWILSLSTTHIPYDGKVASDGTLYVGFTATSGNSTLQKYNPGNNSWTDITPTSGNYYELAVDPFDPQRVIATDGAVRDGHLFRTTNGGSNWDALTVSLVANDIPWITKTDEENWLTTATLVFDPVVQNQLWFPQGTGVWRTSDLSDSDVTWTFESNGIEEFVSTDIAVPPGGKPVTTVMDRNGFYHANPDQYRDRTILTNAFSSGWSVNYSGGNPNFVTVVSSDHRNINPDMSGYSTDGGQNWTLFSGSRNYADLYGGNIAVSATNTSNIVWLPTWGRKPYVSTDRGASWNKQSFFDSIDGLHGMVWWGSKRALDADKVQGGVFYIYSTSNGGEFYRSSNNGQSWEKAPGAAPSSSGNDAHVFGQVHAVPGYAGHVWASTAQGGLYYTENKGDSWNKLSAVQEARAFGFGKAIGGYATVFIYGKINDQWGIWRSTDKGASWDLVGQYPGGLVATPSAVSGDMSIAGRVYVGVGGNGFVYGDTTATSGGNLALGKPASASSTEMSAHTANAAVDGDATTRWSSLFSDPQWLKVDLGTTVSISRVVLQWESAYAKSFKIQVSNDNTNWSDIYSTTNGTGGTQNLTGLSGSGRYVRMYGTQRATTWGYSLFEMEVYS